MNVLLISLAVLSAGADDQIPPEMKVFARNVGTWKTETVTRVAKWTPQEVRNTVTEKRELVLDGRFLQSWAFDDQSKLINIQIYTYDSKKKAYRWWLFDSKGNAGESTGTWDEAKQTLTFTQKTAGGITGVTVARYVDEDTREFTITWKEADGTVGFHMEGKATRQK